MVTIDGLVWDEAAEEHIWRHRVTVEEVEEAATNIGYARMHRGYLVALGETDAGRHLTLVLDRESDDFWYPVTARDMTRSERRLLRKR